MTIEDKPRLAKRRAGVKLKITMSERTYKSAVRFLKVLFLAVLESALIYGLVSFFLSLK